MFHVYPGTGHGFANEESPLGCLVFDAVDAISRIDN